MYAVWIKIDETLPWIELRGTHRTKREAKRSVEKFLSNIKIRFVTMPEKRRRMMVTVKHARN